MILHSQKTLVRSRVWKSNRILLGNFLIADLVMFYSDLSAGKTLG